MEDSIITKLRALLLKYNPMTEECHVVYLLVEIRKLMERIGPRDCDYPIVRFYCNWAVHPCKDRDNKAIVPIVNKIYQSINNGYKFEEQKIFIPADSSGLEFMGLEQLKQEIISLFAYLSLPQALFDDNNWASFRDLLIQVLIDQPINNPTDDIKLVCFEPVLKGAARFAVEFTDGRTRHTFMNVF